MLPYNFLLLTNLKTWFMVTSYKIYLFEIPKKKKKLLPNSRSFRFSPSKSFACLCFTFRPMIHFELIFAMGVRSMSRFFFSFFFLLHVNAQFTMCWKDCFCSIVLSLLLCQRSVDYIYGGLFLGALFSSISLFVYSFSTALLYWLL